VHEQGQNSVVGVGYEGLTSEEFLRELQSLGVDVLVDVRLTPISRKRGFSKRALAAAVETVGVRYEHLPALGNPKNNRAGFAGDSAELTDARAQYSARLGSPDAATAIAKILDLKDEGRVALLCFEADQQRCHRHVLLERLNADVQPVPA
jgi:uncharacterized protein (DUF488 family)